MACVMAEQMSRASRSMVSCSSLPRRRTNQPRPLLLRVALTILTFILMSLLIASPTGVCFVLSREKILGKIPSEQEVVGKPNTVNIFASAFTWGQFEADCTRRDWFGAVTICRDKGGRLASSVHSAATIGSITDGQCNGRLAGYWLGAECSAQSKQCTWHDDSTDFAGWAPGNPTLIGESSGVLFQLPTRAFINSKKSYRGTTKSPTKKMVSLCEYKLCAEDDCDPIGKGTVYVGKRITSSADVCCVCKPRFAGARCGACAAEYFGTECSLTRCWARASTHPCSTHGTAQSLNDNAVPNCCQCSARYQGELCDRCADGYTAYPSCANELCFVRGNTCSVIGTVQYSPNSIRDGTPGCCSCHSHYAGKECATRVCHADYDCRGNAVAVRQGEKMEPRVSGMYPNCVCRCKSGYGGRNCRTLTATVTGVFTLSNTQLISNSVSRTESKTSFLSPSPTYAITSTRTAHLSTTPSDSGSISRTQSRSGSTSLSSLASFTNSILFRTSMSDANTTSSSMRLTASPSSPLTITQSGISSPTPSSLLTQSSSLTPSASQKTPSRSITMESSVSGSSTCPVEAIADLQSLPRTTTWNSDPTYLIDEIRPIKPIVRHRVAFGDLLKVVQEDGTAENHSHLTLKLRSDVAWKEGLAQNITGYLELIRGPSVQWQPKGLRSRSGHRVAVDYDGASGELTAHIPTIDGLLVDEEEDAIIYVSAVALFGCGGKGLWLSIATLTVVPQLADKGVKTAAAVTAQISSILGGANDLQSVAIIGLMPCSNGLTSQLASSESSLSPFAVSIRGSSRWLGVLVGNAMAMACAGTFSALALVVVSWRVRCERRRMVWAAHNGNLKVREDLTGLVGAASFLRLPSLPLRGLMYLYASTTTAAVRGLLDGIAAVRQEVLFDPYSDPSSEASAPPQLGSGPLEVIISLFFLVVFVIGLPAGMILFSSRFITRGYARLDYSHSILEPRWAASSNAASASGEGNRPTMTKPAASLSKFFACLMFPQGVFFPAHTTTRMFGPLVTASRHAPLLSSEGAAVHPKGSPNISAGMRLEAEQQSAESIEHVSDSFSSINSVAPTALWCRVRHSWVWLTLPMWSCWITTLGQLFLMRDVSLCRAMLGVLALLHFGAAALVSAVRPHPILFNSVVSAIGLVLTGLVMVISAALIGGATSNGLRMALVVTVTAQTGVGLLRTVHSVFLVLWPRIAGLIVSVRLKRGNGPQSENHDEAEEEEETASGCESPGVDGFGPDEEDDPLGLPSLQASKEEYTCSDDSLHLSSISDLGDTFTATLAKNKNNSFSLSRTSPLPTKAPLDDHESRWNAFRAPYPPLAWCYDVDSIMYLRLNKDTLSLQSRKNINHQNAARHCDNKLYKDAVSWLVSLPYDDNTPWRRYFYQRSFGPFVEHVLSPIGKALHPLIKSWTPAKRPARSSQSLESHVLDGEELAIDFGGREGSLESSASVAAIHDLNSTLATDRSEDRSNRMGWSLNGIGAQRKKARESEIHVLKAKAKQQGYIFRRAEEIRRGHEQRVRLQEAMEKEEAAHQSLLGYAVGPTQTAPSAEMSDEVEMVNSDKTRRGVIHEKHHVSALVDPEMHKKRSSTRAHHGGNTSSFTTDAMPLMDQASYFF